MGVEPTTLGTTNRCSAIELRSPYVCTPNRIRTCDLLLRRQLLYPAELWVPVTRHYGRSERIRTSDPLLPKQVRYQAALHSAAVGPPSIATDPPVVNALTNFFQPLL